MNVLPQPTARQIPPVPTSLDHLSASVTWATSCRIHSVLVSTQLCPNSSVTLITYHVSLFADVDECAESRSLCGDTMRCVNTDGGYQCDCYPGFTENDDGRCTGEMHKLALRC